jgi:uncharacterized membrane protein (DUF485 family)
MPLAGFEPAILVTQRPFSYLMGIMMMIIAIIITTISLGRAISQATSRWRLTSEARV